MLIDDYYNLQNEYVNKFGDKTIVFMVIGSFFESYSKDNVNPDLAQISEILNIVYTRRDKNKDDSPFMLGFPVQMIHKYLRKLINEEYTVVLFKQVQNGSKFDRVLDAIYSPSTYCDDVQNQNNFMCGLYIEKSGLQSLLNYHISMTFIDVSTGEINFIEEHFNSTENMCNFIHSIELEINPREYIIFYDNANIDQIENLLKNSISKKYTNVVVKEKPIHYQVEFFKKVYSNSTKVKKTNLIHIFDFLEITNYHTARQSLLFTLEFCYSLNSNIINFIKKPKLYRQNSLILGNDAISQLNIIDNNNLSVLNKQYKSVFDVVCNCFTSMGKRYFLKKICKPSINQNEIQSFYNLSKELLPISKIVSIILKRIRDIEKIGRKIMMTNVYPNELYNFLISLNELLKLSTFELKSIQDLFDFSLNDMFQNIHQFLEYCERHFYIDVLSQITTIKDIKNNFIKDSEIQNIIDVLNRNTDVYEDTVDQFIKLLNETEKSGKKTSKLEIKNSKDGKYISMSTTKADKLISKLSNGEKEKYEFIKVNKLCKIFINASVDSNLDSNELMNKLNFLVRKKFFSILENMQPYFEYFYMWSDFVSIVDFCINNCILQEKFGYTCPDIIKDENSFIDLEDVRHPVIERIINTEYIPNSINMKDDKHILLFGLNSAGKSSFQKSIGISIILAQSGCYVPAKRMNYSPFEKLYVRITGNDNIFKGLSSFSVEMSELNTILQNSGKNTLVIGDEVARGTENISAVSIVASSLNKLTLSNTTFIFASHFHELCDLPLIKNLNLSYYHLDVKYDDENGKLIFNRKLQRGKCQDLYGLTVAKSIIHDTSFIKVAEQVCREIKGLKQNILNDKNSRYNSKVFVDECMLCKCVNDKKLETHHILEQQNCDEYKSKEKPHVSKNSVGNLIVLCEKCHQQLHSKDLKIIKLETSEGIEIKVEK